MIQPAVFNKFKGGNNVLSARSICGVDDIVSGFYIFKIIWMSDQIIWLDVGRQIWNITDCKKIPHQEAYLSMSGTVGDAWTVAPATTTSFPTRMLINYVTDHQRK
jgi:beta-glucanase (GH16 family)